MSVTLQNVTPCTRSGRAYILAHEVFDEAHKRAAMFSGSRSSSWTGKRCSSTSWTCRDSPRQLNHGVTTLAQRRLLPGC